ncbi:myosin-binding protein 3-like isoform X2 [Cucurbita maxima]|uniref:Myosin-binding protein 3-like isoform X2 n=1 Tax=Cucurbita maxima TaxID=3661 RepID=A0A6J1K5C8_CUCMA|nr:myosin-binding protein 3-like isoform X2 [Cucurbita maxima]
MFRDSDNESSKSDEKHANHKSDSESSDSDKKNTDHNSDSESFESNEEREVNFNAKQSFEKETYIGTNDLKQPPLISTTAAECSKTDEEVYKSAIKNVSDGVDHSSASEASQIDKEQEVFDCTVGQSLKNESDLVVNDLKQSSENGNTHIIYSESSESDKEQENVNFSIQQSLEKETDIGINDLKQCPVISTTVEECSKTNEGVYEYAIKNTNDDMDHDNISESSENGNEYEISNFVTRQSLEKETDIVIEVTYEFAIKNTIDDMDHDNISESSENGNEYEIFNFATRQSLEKETDIVTEVTYESAIKNTNDDMDHDNISEFSENGNEYEIFNFATRQSLEKETDIVTEVTYESAIKNTNDDMKHSNVDESFDKQQDVLNCATGQPLETDPDIVSTDREQFSMSRPVGLVNQSSSNDEGHNFSIFDDDLQKESSVEFNIIRALDRSVSMESVESLDGSNVSEIEGENMVDKLKRQVEYDKKCMNYLYKELEEERNASEVAASQAMAMITRLQEEKAAMKMDSLQYLRMMEEQAEYDVEALEKANELLNEKEREIQELETELEHYRSNYLMDTIVESEHEQSDGANEEDTIAEHHEYTANYSFKSTIAEASKGSNRSLNNQTSSLEFEDEKVYIQLCLKRLEDKINKIFANRLLPRLPNCIGTEEEASPEQIGEGSDDERSIHKITCNGRVTAEEEFGSEQNFGNVKVEVSCGDKRGGEEIDFLSLANKISELTGRLEAVQADNDFLEHSPSSLRYGEEGLQFAHNIVHQLHESCKLGIRVDPQSAS